MNTDINVKYCTIAIPSNEIIKRSNTTGIVMLLCIGSARQSHTLVGGNYRKFIINSERSSIQRPSGFTEFQASKVVTELNKKHNQEIPTPDQISRAISRTNLGKYFKPRG